MNGYGRVYQRLDFAKSLLEHPVCKTVELSIHTDKVVETVLKVIENAQEFLYDRWYEEKGEPNGKL